jgi:phospholipase/carboxylesterase
MTLHSIKLAPLEPGLTRTLVLLHGYGADEHDLLSIAHVLDPRLAAVSLQAPIQMMGSQRAWFELMEDERGIAFDPDQARAGLDQAIASVEAIAAESPRPFLLGFSQGAAMALGVLLRKPSLVAGVIALSGVTPLLEPRDLATPEELRAKPVFVAHGTRDPLLPIELGRTLHDELVRLGLAVEWREFPMGHMVIPEELHEAQLWLKARL